MKTLEQLTDEMEAILSRLEKIRSMFTPQICPTCHKLKTDPDDLISIYHANECLCCEHVRVNP